MVEGILYSSFPSCSNLSPKISYVDLAGVIFQGSKLRVEQKLSPKSLEVTGSLESFNQLYGNVDQ